MNASKAVNGLDCVKEVLLNVKDNKKLIEHIEYAQRVIEEQEERIAIMQESDNLGGVGCFPVYEFEKGHCRTVLHTDENGFIAMWLSTDDYAEPGSQPGINGKEIPVFGLRLRDAEHARHVEKAFCTIADFIEKMEVTEDGK